MMTKLEEDKSLQAAERERIEEEVRLKQEEIDKVRGEVEEKERLARELQVNISLRYMTQSVYQSNLILGRG